MKNFLNQLRILCKAFLSSILDKKPRLTNQYNNRILIVKVDGLGDYILFRNCLAAIKRSERFHNFQIDMVANSINQELIESYDSRFLAKTWFVLREHLHLKQKVRNDLLREINQENYKLVINWTHSRVIFDDLFVRNISAQQKVTFKGDTINQPRWLKKLTNNFYTELVQSSSNVKFEHLRNLDLLSHLIGFEKSETLNFGFELGDEISKKHDSDTSYVVLCPGATDKKRIWSVEQFSGLIDALLDKNYCSKIFICGALSDKTIATKIVEKSRNKNLIYDTSGQKRLSELPDFFRKAKRLITMESGLAHLAAASGANYFCISNGNHLGRFHPYPGNVSSGNGSYIYPTKIEEDIRKHTWEKVVEKHGRKSPYDTSEISVQRVLTKLLT